MKRTLKAMAIVITLAMICSHGLTAQHRPGSSGGHRMERPGAQQPGGNRPGAQQPGGNRPGAQQAPRPPMNMNPAPAAPGRPSMNPGRPAPMNRPPIVRNYAPPRPPMGWQPAPGLPMFNSIFGLTFGAALNFSINSLINNGYNIYSYNNDTVYLNNVSYFGYNWPDATLFYGPGGFSRSELFYSTLYYDMNRYNNVYNYITRQYGLPYSSSNNGSGVSATWFAGNGNYITLSYQPQYGQDGMYRYYTTLTLGN